MYWDKRIFISFLSIISFSSRSENTDKHSLSEGKKKRLHLRLLKLQSPHPLAQMIIVSYIINK